MKITHRPALYLTTTLVLLFLNNCVANNTSYSPLIGAEPEIGSTLTRAPRTLRLYYDALPDVASSELTLRGPNGELALRGLHTMAADDLMIEIMDDVIDGSYTVEWVTKVQGSDEIHQGAFEFQVDTQ